MEFLTTVAVPVVTALIGAGFFQYVFKWLSDRPRNRAHQNRMWEDFKNETLEAVRAEKRILEEKVTLLEFRHNLRDELESVILDELEELGVPAVRVNKYREVSRGIRFSRDIEELKKIRVR